MKCLYKFILELLTGEGAKIFPQIVESVTRCRSSYQNIARVKVGRFLAGLYYMDDELIKYDLLLTFIYLEQITITFIFTEMARNIEIALLNNISKQVLN